MTLLSRSERRIRIVLADNNAEFRALCRNLIESQTDMEIVAEVPNRENLLGVALQQTPDIVLLSLELGGLGSMLILEQFQESHLAVRVIAVCREMRQEDCVTAVRLGCRGLLPDGTASEMLLKCIRKVYEGEMWLDRTTTAEVLRRLTEENAPSRKSRSREDRVSPLSPREREIVGLVTRGLRNRELADKLAISEQTVKNHMHNIFDKLGVTDRLELALYAIHNGLHGLTANGDDKMLGSTRKVG